MPSLVSLGSTSPSNVGVVMLLADSTTNTTPRHSSSCPQGPITVVGFARGYAHAHAAKREGYLVLDSVSLVEGEPVYLAFRRGSTITSGAKCTYQYVSVAVVSYRDTTPFNLRPLAPFPPHPQAPTTTTLRYVAGLRLAVPTLGVLADVSLLGERLNEQRGLMEAAALAAGAGAEAGAETGVRAVPKAVVVAGIEGGVTGGVSNFLADMTGERRGDCLVLVYYACAATVRGE